MTISSSHTTQLPWVAPLHDVIVAGTNKRLEAIGSENRINWTESYGGALYGFGDTLEAVGDGITDAGWVGALWEEAKLPYDNVTFYTPFTTDDPALLLETFNGLHRTMPVLEAEWSKHNVVLLGATAADTYHLYTNFPVSKLDDLKGRKILTAGSAAPWIAATGAVPVNGALTTYYSQIETGVADGVLANLTGAHPVKLQEVAPYVTIVGAGANLIGGFAVNKDIWEGLPEDVQGVLRELGPAYSARNAQLLQQRYDVIVGELEADPKVTLTTLAPEERQKWVNALPDLAAKWSADLPEGKALLKAYMSAIRAAGGQPLRDWSAD